MNTVGEWGWFWCVGDSLPIGRWEAFLSTYFLYLVTFEWHEAKPTPIFHVVVPTRKVQSPPHSNPTTNNVNDNNNKNDNNAQGKQLVSLTPASCTSVSKYVRTISYYLFFVS